jgi:hypothetical protein
MLRGRCCPTSWAYRLKDLGIELPPYTEDVVELDMEDAQARQYGEMESILRHMALRDSRYLSLWLQWALARPNSAFRDEVVMLNHAAVPPNHLAALAKELLEATDMSGSASETCPAGCQRTGDLANEPMRMCRVSCLFGIISVNE